MKGEDEPKPRRSSPTPGTSKDVSAEENDQAQRSRRIETPAEGETTQDYLISSIYNFLVIITFFLVGFAAFRNTLTWYVNFSLRSLFLCTSFLTASVFCYTHAPCMS